MRNMTKHDLSIKDIRVEFRFFPSEGVSVTHLYNSVIVNGGGDR